MSTIYEPLIEQEIENPKPRHLVPITPFVLCGLHFISDKDIDIIKSNIEEIVEDQSIEIIYSNFWWQCKAIFGNFNVRIYSFPENNELFGKHIVEITRSSDCNTEISRLFDAFRISFPEFQVQSMFYPLALSRK